ncbi:uncharacterized protein DS421_14g457140 [Arachis hypogaea]|nr:uncharacterized protein DS421_14g457140 [Arachis hypogaea]
MSTFRQALDSNAPTPASAGPTVGATPVGPAPPAPVRSNRVDPDWKYISTVEEGNTNDSVYTFCEKIMKGGITRAKEHLMIKFGNVAGCKMVPKDVIAELWEYYHQKKNRGRQSATPENTEEQSVNARELDLESLGFIFSEEDA